MMASWKCLSLDEEGQNGGETQATFVCSHVEETKVVTGASSRGWAEAKWAYRREGALDAEETQSRWQRLP